jgi:putative ABC transport system permease protein
MLFQVSAADPATFAAAAMFLGLVAGIASYLPAVRATRLDPMRAIRRQ